jgi:hypothetical protein
MQPDIQTTIGNVLAPLPIKERLWALAYSIVTDNPGAVLPIKALVSMAALMAGQLSAGQRAEIARHMHREADALAGRLH